jgi:hypothetical protein
MKAVKIRREYHDPSSTQNLLAISGMFAPVLLVSLVIGLSLLEPEYNHRTDMMSILGGKSNFRLHWQWEYLVIYRG